jgi:hypothetical protein
VVKRALNRFEKWQQKEKVQQVNPQPAAASPTLCISHYRKEVIQILFFEIIR